MTWTYDPAVRSDRNRVRERVGDIDTSEQLISDEVIDEVLAELPTVARASARVARLMHARLSRQADRVVDGVNVTHARIESIDALISRLDQEAGGTTPVALMRAGGTSASRERELLDDPDYEPVPAGWATERVR